MKTNQNNLRAFTLIEIMIVVTIIGVLLAIAVPNFSAAREAARKKSCISNLWKIQYAKDSYMMNNNRPNNTPASEFTDTALYGDTGFTTRPVCPGGGSYQPNDGNVLPTCDYAGGGVHTIAP
ncbi:MAG: type II secretion system protein [Capsulimonadales bacterium]|nr:type II secretion system protein [Capsulimonadales bacterium]